MYSPNTPRFRVWGQLRSAPLATLGRSAHDRHDVCPPEPTSNDASEGCAWNPENRSSVYLPGAHVTHADCPFADENVPVGHGAHENPTPDGS